MNERVPNPGSEEAIRIGCKCAVIDNHHGFGFTQNKEGEPLFWINAACPVHGRESQDDER